MINTNTCINQKRPHISCSFVCFNELIINYLLSLIFRFPFAITGINITYIAYHLLKSGRLKTHFYNSLFGTLCLEDFHKVYCKLINYSIKVKSNYKFVFFRLFIL